MSIILERYVVIRKPTLELLELRVKERMNGDKRWTPTGAPFWSQREDSWCQAIYIKEN